MNEENDLLGEYPDDDYQEDEEDENIDSDGEPLPSPEQIRDIINAIPSYRFEEKQAESAESSLLKAGKEIVQKPSTGSTANESLTDRKRAEIKRKENDVICSICLERLKTGIQVKELFCKHVFHTSCINSWLKEKLQCPNCKKRVKL